MKSLKPQFNPEDRDIIEPWKPANKSTCAGDIYIYSVYYVHM